MATINFKHLRYFWAVAKEGNLTRAAGQLHVSQSALSEQIKQLEIELGQPLFHRTGRTLTLTLGAGKATAGCTCTSTKALLLKPSAPQIASQLRSTAAMLLEPLLQRLSS